MWKIWNKIFGWDYIIWQNRYDDSGVSRLRRDYINQVWWYRYNITKAVYTMRDHSHVIKVWLTCEPSKWKDNQ